MKKILSLILALSLIISVAPMSFATGTEVAANDGMHFNFSAANWDKDATEDIPAEVIKANGDANVNGGTPVFAKEGTDPWYIDGQRLIKDYRLTSEAPDTVTYPNAEPNALYWNVVGSYIAPYKGNAQAVLVLRVTISETGVFTPSITYEGGPTSTKYTFFLAPISEFTTSETGYKFYEKSDGTGDLGDKNITHTKPLQQSFGEGTQDASLIKLGEKDLSAKEANKGKKTFEFSTAVNIKEAGDYYLYIVPSGKGNYAGSHSTSRDYYLNLYSIDFEPMPKETADAAFTATEDTENPPVNVASIAAYTVCGTEDPVSFSAPEVTYGETCELDAPETKTGEDGKTYNFLYWARGLESASNRKIVSTENKLTYRPHEGVNYLIAVYEEENASKVEFYNGNGELMTDVSLDGGNLPAVPYMAGYGESTGWKRQGDEKVYEAGTPAPTDGSMVFVAQYDDPAEDIEISINGVSENYAYGDPVECKIDETKKGTFSYWEKTINGKSQIVSLDETYTFNAWETCTVTAVYNGAFNLGRTARKILFGTFTVGDQTAVMAEFIGFDGAKEKGIMFGDTKRIAMTTTGNQFTITNDTASEATVTGYAVVDNSRYVDGEITVAAAPVVATE